MTNVSHEDVFIQYYSRLRSWAVQITGQDYALAEDLLHDAFIQFTHSQPDLENIENLDGYLYGVLRNLHLSHLRKTTRRNKYQLSIIEFETARLGLGNADARDDFQIREELKKICYYLCLRKETARAAGVMILRFFHGYYPGEIARVLRTTPQAVKVRLRLARIEVKAALENPESTKRVEENLPLELKSAESFRSNSDLTTALGEMIFSSRAGDCRADEELHNLYRETHAQPQQPVDTATLAHLVSCRKCLDKVNALLGLPPISERYSVDFVGKDNGHNGGSGSGGGGGSNGSGGNMDEDKIDKIRHKWRRGLREVYEHEPRELFISINGQLQGSQKILRNHNKQSVKIDSAGEPLRFVEVFSEQNVRLAFISLDDEAAPGENQNCLVNLSEDRSLNLNLIQTGSETLVEVVYHDPFFEETEVLLARELASANQTPDFLQKKEHTPEKISLFADLPESGKKRRLAAFAGSLKDKIFPAGFGFNPLTAAAALAIFIVLALAVGRFLVLVPEVSAGEILARAGNSEEIDETTAGAVIHRTINLEERKSGGELLRKNKIETWTDAARKLSVRRLYDEKNQIIAGEWRRKDGVSTYYAPERMPQLRRVPTDKEVVADADSENIWRLSVSAKGFESLVETPEKAAVERRGDNYVISYQTGKNQGVVKAVLVLNNEMRASEQILTVRKDNEDREFRFTETNFEKKRPETVENSVFEPGKELLRQSPIIAANNREIEKGEPLEQQLQTESNPAVNAEKISPAAAAATQELEVKVLELLNNANALAGDQINIVKTPDGKLRIDGIVDARSRKEEILNALAPVRGNPALQINILTAGEATLNKSGKRGAGIAPGAIENVTVESRKSIPAGDALRNYFSGGGLPEDKIEAEIRRFASSVMAKSSQMRRAALSMKQIAERFSASDLEKMDEPTRAQWRRLVRQNAANLLRQSEALRNELRPVFNNNSTGAGGNVNVADDAELIRAAKRLFDLSLAVDGDVRASFSLSNGNSAAAGGVAVKSGKFDNSLSEIINLSRQFR